MNGSNLKYFAIGAIVAAGLGVALTLPAPFAAGEALSAKKLNDYFDAIKTAINSLEADASVSSSRLADNAVTTTKIAAGAVGNTDLADTAVTTVKIADGAVSAEKIFPGAVTESRILNGAVTGPKIVSDAITTDKIANGNITTGDLANDTITNEKIVPDTITAGRVKDEPGVAQGRTASTVIAVGTTPTITGSTTLSAPANGFALVIGAGTFCTIHTKGLASSAIVGVSDSTSLVSGRFQTIHIDGERPTGYDCQVVSVQHVFPVNQGTNTFRFLVRDISAVPLPVTMSMDAVTISAMYFPTSYGSVTQ